MSIRIIPQDELEKSEKRATDMIPPLLFPRLKNLYNRRAERLRELAENNPLGDYLRFAALIAHAQEVVLYDHPLQMDLTARIKEANDQGKPPLDIHVLPRDKHWHKLLHSLIAELKPEMSGPGAGGHRESGKSLRAGAGTDGKRAVCVRLCLCQQR
ncbi:formate dehydrogenase formation protein FdhE [Klebsiella michiganensis]|nr:formate dehydrogenase formation protein FdhE [Klebsiella michiganensis]